VRLDSVRELKASLNEAIIKPMAASPVARAALGMAAQPIANAGDGGPTMALGIVRSQGGDSGSLIVDADRKAVAILFAGGDLGGSNGKGLTFANPIDAVLKALKIELLFT
jgi:hypothetical protein